MAENEFGEKTEDPTEHRRLEERRKGNIAHSSELNIAGHLVVTAAVLLLMGRSFVESLGRMMAGFISTADNRGGDAGAVQAEFVDVAIWAAENVLPWFGALLLGAIAFNLAQVGFVATTEKLQPNFNAINPVTGLKRLFSIRSLVTLAISLGKLTLLFSAVAWFVWSSLPMFVGLSGQDALTTFMAIGQSVVKLALILAAILLVLGLADFGFQKWKYEQDIKMTKEELKREIKDMEGDPMIRRRRREAYQKLVEARDIGAVSSSSFMLTNPTHVSVAFRYEPPEYPVPTVVAKGLDDVALRMREVAAEHGVPIIERPELAREVYRTLKVGQGIPTELYEVFIEILKYVYTITGRTIDTSDVEQAA